MPSEFYPDDGSIEFKALETSDFLLSESPLPAVSVFGGRRGNFIWAADEFIAVEFQYKERNWSEPDEVPPYGDLLFIAIGDAQGKTLAAKSITNAADIGGFIDATGYYQTQWRWAWKPVSPTAWNFVHLRWQLDEWLTQWDDGTPPTEPSVPGARQEYWGPDATPETYDEAERITWPGTAWVDTVLPTVPTPIDPPDFSAYTNTGETLMRILWPRLFSGELGEGASQGTIPGVRPQVYYQRHWKFGALHLP